MSSTTGESGQWTYLYAVSILVAIPMFLLTFRIPRSKRWLLHHGFKEEALDSMSFVYRGNRLQEEFKLLVSQLERSKSTGDNDDCWNDDDNDAFHILSIWNSKYRPALIASKGLIFFQQFSGQPSVLSYVTVLFQAAGWSGDASVITALLMMCTSIMTVALVDRVGRKRLLAACCIIMITALVALSGCFWWHDDATTNGVLAASTTTLQQRIILVAMFAYIGGYQVGFGPITWCIVSEVFPLEIRGKAIALGVEWNYLLNFLVKFTLPILHDTLGWGPSFGIFACPLMACIVFVQMQVPETTGMTLEEIQIQLQQPGQSPARGGVVRGATIAKDTSHTTKNAQRHFHEESPLLS